MGWSLACTEQEVHAFLGTWRSGDRAEWTASGSGRGHQKLGTKGTVRAGRRKLALTWDGGAKAEGSRLRLPEAGRGHALLCRMLLVQG